MALEKLVGYMNFGARHAGFGLRNQEIAAAIEKRPSWILDVGSNLGETSNYLSDQGHFVIGIESLRRENTIARKRARPTSAFLNAAVTPELIASAPGWDVILLLSVLHRIYAFDGEDMMRSVVRSCAGKCDVIFIEGSTRHDRYTDQGRPAPDFVNLDEHAALAWYTDMLTQELGQDWKVEFMSMLPCSKIEPYRLLIKASRNGR